ncbi:MAG: class I SAM-dependent methyltransferase [Sphingomonadaceae bacterium]|nr:class I SAM-dependent methyltransferase [Sphingomonadaceae bacterium]
MAQSTPPVIFSQQRRRAVRNRMFALQQRSDAPSYLMADMADDVLDRISFLRVEPKNALVIGDYHGLISTELRRTGAKVAQLDPANGFDEEQPFPQTGFDFIVSLGTLDTVNDLPGALIHIRNALEPGGMMIASFMGAGSLPMLRQVMLAADADRPAPRLHPQVDVRAGGQLLQRTQFADPVIDSRSLDVSFRSLGGLLADLRAQGLSNVLADPGPRLAKVALTRANDAFHAAGKNGRTVERFEILTLSGWRR